VPNSVLTSMPLARGGSSAAIGMPRLDHEVVSWCTHVGQRHLGDIKPEEPGTLVGIVGRRRNFDHSSSQFRIAGRCAQRPGWWLYRRAVNGYPRSNAAAGIS
jgi:hypothetical protein